MKKLKASPTDSIVIARWETKKNDFLELTRNYRCFGKTSYAYRGNGNGGVFYAYDDVEAIVRMNAPWGDAKGVGAVTVLSTDRPSLKRVQ